MNSIRSKLFEKHEEHNKKRKSARKINDKKLENFHLGCMSMALQIAEEFAVELETIKANQ